MDSQPYSQFAQFPRSLVSRVNGPHADGWFKSMEAEYNSPIENDTWELTDLPKRQKAIGCC